MDEVTLAMRRRLRRAAHKARRISDPAMRMAAQRKVRKLATAVLDRME